MGNNILANRYEVQKQSGKKAGRRTLLAKDLQTQELVISCCTFNLYNSCGQDARTTRNNNIRIIGFSCVTA